jgi:hypothetical protein
MAQELKLIEKNLQFLQLIQEQRHHDEKIRIQVISEEFTKE